MYVVGLLGFIILYGSGKHMYHGKHVELRGQLLRVGFLFPLCVPQGSNSAHQTWWQTSLPTKPSCSPIDLSSKPFLSS